MNKNLNSASKGGGDKTQHKEKLTPSLLRPPAAKQGKTKKSKGNNVYDLNEDLSAADLNSQDPIAGKPRSI